MYAVIRAGGKQYKVQEGQTLDVELSGEPGVELELTPVMLVDGASIFATPRQIGKAKVTATVLELVKDRKINGFVYKNKSNQRRRWGHRQQKSRIQITAIQI
ncbi:MAG: 50S ribosomal protein L21 [Acidimicrobiia bacterium]|nr:50S ribosomal protein L21 [Acidimicrobiia bacterium]MYC58119.1 50S ribosomal protein L21 [Acidimicrobiia bacterium]MYG94391.1 50S ribosomal protein L21 [Acidimicrobiia bacterium]MYI30551.1 50S ribosomal protein L21 [Acidimicrobiia bacterium]